ncbi:U3-aranetoxin-Ce1a-like [Uloborus diversus]|uniref:U3-aranetoxin-Ce1a-like n=1 Tax=Uloborus diversus TaxID=327109 RepID=UPI00240A7E21|nr:U3-aranetoxin-Ce1a-like [Uloborus diversus]
MIRASHQQQTTMLLLLIAISLLHAVSSRQFAQKLCQVSEDCDWNQCCIESQTRIPGFNGICSNPVEEGEICDPDLEKTIDGRYIDTCPCDSGLVCQLFESQGETVYTCQ